MNTSKSKAYIQGCESLENIRLLCSPDDYKLVSQTEFYFERLFNEINDLHKTFEDGLSQGREFLKERILQDISSWTSNIPFTKVFFDIEHCIPLKTLSRFSECYFFIPALLEAFKFSGEMDIKFDKRNFSIIGEISHDEIGSRLKKLAYSVTQSCLKNKVLLTYHLEETSMKTVKLKINFDLDPYGNGVLWISNSGPFIDFALPGGLEAYEVFGASNVESGRHTCVLIDEFLNVRKVNRAPRSVISLTDNGHSLYHIPFLFRPLSLIIPGKARWMPELEFTRLNEIARKQGTSASFLDLYDLMNA
jgi:hypothetical protein